MDITLNIKSANSFIFEPSCQSLAMHDMSCLLNLKVKVYCPYRSKIKQYTPGVINFPHAGNFPSFFTPLLGNPRQPLVTDKVNLHPLFSCFLCILTIRRNCRQLAGDEFMTVVSTTACVLVIIQGMFYSKDARSINKLPLWEDVGGKNETEIQRWLHLRGETVRDRGRLRVSQGWAYLDPPASASLGTWLHFHHPAVACPLNPLADILMQTSNTECTLASIPSYPACQVHSTLRVN